MLRRVRTAAPRWLALAIVAALAALVGPRPRGGRRFALDVFRTREELHRRSWPVQQAELTASDAATGDRLRLLGGALRRHGAGRRQRQDSRGPERRRRRLRLHALGARAGRSRPKLIDPDADERRLPSARRWRSPATRRWSAPTVATVDGQSGAGAAYVFTRSGTSWSQQAELTDPDATRRRRLRLVGGALSATRP